MSSLYYFILDVPHLLSSVETLNFLFLTDVQVAANSASPIMLLPTSTMMVQPQPYVLVNPTELQQVNVTPLLNNNNFFSTTTKVVPEILNTGAGNGFILVSPNPVVQVVSTASSRVINSGEWVQSNHSY